MVGYQNNLAEVNTLGRESCLAINICLSHSWMAVVEELLK